ncbi:MAG: FHA domain-containing protein [Myxococcota bacterium]
MNDEELGEALKALGMDAASWRSLPLLPLVQVAWADGEVQDAERELILQLADEKYHLEEEGRRLLRNWLTHPPSLAYVRRGQKVLVGLCDRDGMATRDQLADVVGFAKDVARAAGGFFGYASIAGEEAAAIDEIADALDILHDRPWVTPEDPTMIPADADADRDGPPLQIEFHPRVTGRSRATLIQFDELRGEQSCSVGPEGVTIGRNRENDIQVSYDAQVSRRHCRLYESNGRYYVEDLASTAGTWVNGERVVERRLLGGETLHVGAVGFFFQLSP